MLEEDSRRGEIDWGTDREYPDSPVRRAAEGGHWDLVWWLDARVNTNETRESDQVTMTWAFLHSNFEQVKKLVAMGFSGTILPHGENVTALEWRRRAPTLRYILERVGNPWFSGVIGDAARFGDIGYLELIAANMTRRNEYFPAESALTSACWYGQFSVVEWALGNVPSELLPHFLSTAMFAAAERGNLRVVQWLYEAYGRDYSKYLFREKQRWEDDYHNERDALYVMDAAASGGNLELVKFLHQTDVSLRDKDQKSVSGDTCLQGLACTTAAMDGAAANGHYDVVKRLHFNRSEGCTKAAMDAVASGKSDNGPVNEVSSNQRLELLRWLHQNRIEGCSSNAMDSAASNGDLEMLHWLQQSMDVQCTIGAMEEAARSGHLDVVEWIHRNSSVGCSFEAMANAAENGHFEVLKWLHAHYPELDMSSALAAPGGRSSLRHEQLRMVKWITNICSDDTAIMVAILNAIEARNFEVILYLHTLRPTYIDEDVPELSRVFDGEQDDDLPRLEPIRLWMEEKYLMEEREQT